ncbi:hypothetical protein MPH_01808 [Macrophomina phaseolina MS6]|uniref:Uncharacterized protein n=1 Tax=Macrophomina phaseolina (strain MS6) TaxID=1126212 RepID=K2SET6_MACPH|nr:hypothetical protein MPH_01808 [Macrophomina phaseolina MS6]
MAILGTLSEASSRICPTPAGIQTPLYLYQASFRSNSQTESGKMSLLVETLLSERRYRCIWCVSRSMVIKACSSCSEECGRLLRCSVMSVGSLGSAMSPLLTPRPGAGIHKPRLAMHRERRRFSVQWDRRAVTTLMNWIWLLPNLGSDIRGSRWQNIGASSGRRNSRTANFKAARLILFDWSNQSCKKFVIPRSLVALSYPPRVGLVYISIQLRLIFVLLTTIQSPSSTFSR